jgi:hypothetical protein
MKVTIQEQPKGYQELQWARTGKNTYSATSVDGVREYTVKASGDDDTIMLWGLAWRVKGEQIQYADATFLNRHEAHEVAQNIENLCDLDETKLREVAAGNAVTVGGNNWKYYGIHANKRLWVCVLPGDKIAYVATQTYGSKKWTVSKREWVGSDIGDIEKLEIKITGRYKKLMDAQMSVARLTYNSSNGSSANTLDTGDNSLPKE